MQLTTFTNSTTSSEYSEGSTEKMEVCQVCELAARGKHFGVVTCRACAAFFRRADASTTNVKPCKKEKKCQLLNKNGWFHCKWCRLQKCYDVGMTSTNFQFDRDPISMKFREEPVVKSLENFLGRPHCVIFVEPHTVKVKKKLIDCHSLIEKAAKLIKSGSETPLSYKNSLLKMAMALRRIDEKHADNI
uniref:Nuclear receptor domain-containing protein n=1 Tax=Caenorhabditis japonica TaxID=281687 RepID=A0A8R1DMB1_CAEJA